MGTKGDKFEFGEFSVDAHVLEEIAAIAAAKVDGVTGLMAGIAGRRAKRGAGVSATKADDRVEVEIHLVAEYGRPLKEVARQVQASVAESIESMVGGPAATVHVFVDGLAFPAEAG